MDPLIPEWFVSAFAIAVVFVVMFHLGLGIRPREFLWAWHRPALMLKALFSVLVAVPAIALVVARLLGLPQAAEVGIVLMAIAPGAPIALQRAIGAGARRSFAPGLQVTVALAAVVSMPLWIAALDVVYGATASVSPWEIMRQVTVVQLLPLILGALTGRHLPRVAPWVAPVVDRAWKVLLVALVAVAITSAARNPGLALLVAALNDAPLAVKATLLSYMVVAAFTALPYGLVRARRGASTHTPETDP